MHKFEELLKQLRFDPTNNELKQQIQDWLRDNPDDDQPHKLWEEHWQLVNAELSERDHQRLEQLLKQIHTKANIKSAKNNQRATKRIQIRVATIAASLLLPALVLAGIHYFKKANDYSVQSQLIVQESGTETKHLFLPDSTEVWLNSKSELRYAQRFGKTKQREVSLTGQAYFNVRHDAAHPFIVRTRQMDIRVLGTSFDVSAYPDEPTISSTLEEGSIALLDKQGNQLDKLVPGEQATFSIATSSLNKQQVKATDFTSWKAGKLVFRDSGIEEVARKLERRFGCTISISPDLMDENPTYTFSIQDEDLEEICRLIELSTNARATINGSHIQLKEIK